MGRGVQQQKDMYYVDPEVCHPYMELKGSKQHLNPEVPPKFEAENNFRWCQWGSLLPGQQNVLKHCLIKVSAISGNSKHFPFEKTG